jgi:5'-nucleotidase
MKETKYHVLLVNDDGIKSPGLFAAAEALSQISYVTVAAPREQWSGAGRSHPLSSDGMIKVKKLPVNGEDWVTYAVGGSPAQTVVHAIHELCPRRPDLVVSGINYGENAGSGVTASGTVGAALEAASMGIPALAISLEVHRDFQLSYSTEIDFSAAKHFTRLFAEKMLTTPLPHDVDLLKVEVPDTATPDTPWRMTRLSRRPYYKLTIRPRQSLEEPVHIDYDVDKNTFDLEPDGDNYAILVDRLVAVTPMSVDFTSRVTLSELEGLLRK